MNQTDTDTDIEPTIRTRAIPNDADSTPKRQTPPPAPTEPDEKPGLGLSAPQIIGGALAAMTAAALGSRLSVAGTVIGAALVSVVAAVAGAIYTASLRHTGDRVKSVWVGRVGQTPTVVQELPVAAAPTDAAKAPTMPLVASTPTVAEAGRGDGERQAPTRRFPWKRVLVGALATFALAAGVLTGFELLTGQALSGGSGTTIEQVREGGSSDTDDRNQQPSDAESSASADEDSADATEPTPGAGEPSATESASPAPLETAPEDPTAEPTQTTEPSEATPGAEGDQAGAAADGGDAGTN